MEVIDPRAEKVAAFMADHSNEAMEKLAERFAGALELALWERGVHWGVGGEVRAANAIQKAVDCDLHASGDNGKPSSPQPGFPLVVAVLNLADAIARDGKSIMFGKLMHPLPHAVEGCASASSIPVRIVQAYVIGIDSWVTRADVLYEVAAS